MKLITAPLSRYAANCRSPKKSNSRVTGAVRSVAALSLVAQSRLLRARMDPI